MTSRSKEKMAAAFRKLFRSSDKLADGEGGGSSGQAKSGGSPARRLLNRHRDIVTPAEPGPLDNPSPRSSGGLFKKKTPPTPQPESFTQKTVRTRRLMKELKDIQRNEKKDDPVFTVSLVNDNLFEWHVRLHRIDQESDLAADMREQHISHILLHITFPDNFPFAPPFMRVMSPRIERGFVMEGGAICMELLTPRGWASAYTVEAIIMQFAASIVKGQGRIAKKTKSSSKDFTRRSAEESFRSLVKTHEKYGWVTPPLSDG